MKLAEYQVRNHYQTSGSERILLFSVYRGGGNLDTTMTNKRFLEILMRLKDKDQSLKSLEYVPTFFNNKLSTILY